MSQIDILLLGPSDATVLDRLAPDVFDLPVDPRWCAEFFADSRHHLVVARSDGVVVGMASAVHYVHPDKPPQLWINEVAVAATHRRQSVGRQLVERLVELATELECTEVWVLTDADNVAANQLYASAGADVPPAQSVMYTIQIRRNA
jgi:aminoglycoside 6'-N-acetyltransferase I